MSVVTIDVNWDACVGGGAIYDTAVDVLVGYDSGSKFGYRSALRFPLTNLPSGKNIIKVEIKRNCNAAGGASHLTDYHAFNTNGQTDPATVTDPVTFDSYCASGNLYVNDSTDLRATGVLWITLGDGESAQACIDVENAKAAVDRFSVALHEEGDDDAYARIDALEKVGGIKAQLRITYEEIVVAVPKRKLLGVGR